MRNSTICSGSEEGPEDWEMGRCLQHAAVFVDERDEAMGKRFFPAGIFEHLQPQQDPNYWYSETQYYNVAQGSLECCSDTPAAFHYIDPHEMFMLEYLTRYVYPFGFERNVTEKLGKKKTLKEVLQKSDTESLAKNYSKHEFYHDFDESENDE